MTPFRILLLTYNFVCVATMGAICWASIPLLTG